MENDFRKKIIGLLSKHPHGLTILEIANSLDINRNTITKYIYELSGAGVITQRKVSTAKLCLLTKYLKRGESL